jgi:hypothetical protein
MQARYHVAVRRPDDGAILVAPDGSMPGFTLDDAPWWQLVGPVVEALARDVGVAVVVLRAAWLGEPDDRGRVDRLYEATWADGDPPAGWRWVDDDDLRLRLTPLGQAIEAGALRPLRGQLQPWYRPGAVAAMDEWVQAALATTGRRPDGPVRQVRSWGRSLLLRVETDRGPLWAKQVPAVFAHEVTLTELLADIDPGIVPPLVAADAAAGRLLVEHVEGPLLGDDRSSSPAWTATLARLAEIQRVLAADLGAVRVAGVPTLGVDQLADEVARLVADEDLALIGRPGGLTGAQHDRLRAAAEPLADACRALAASAPGPSVDHGDLAASQVIIGEMGPVILDWSDAAITHPFLAAASFLMDPADLPPDADEDLAAAYLAGWTGGVADAAWARRSLDLARIVHPLHMARLYADRILPGLEQRWEMERMVPWFLGSLADRLDDLPRILRG